MTARIYLILTASLAFCSGATATTASNPYQGIAARNVFGLKDPPPPPAKVEPAKPAPKLTLTGILTFGRPRALMKAPAAPPKPGEQPKGEQYFTLGEGERDGDVQVFSIDPKLGKVTLKVAGEPVTLGFDDASKSRGGPAGTPAALSFNPVPSSLPQRLATPGIPLAPPVQLPQGTQPDLPSEPPQPIEVATTGPDAAEQPQAQVESSASQTTEQPTRPPTLGSPDIRGKAIQYPAFDPTPGAVQTRTPFPSRTLRGRGPDGYRSLPTVEPSAGSRNRAMPQ